MHKKLLAEFLFIFLMISSFSLAVSAQTQINLNCEQCGMTIDATGQARFKILDVMGSQHVACCPVCALRLISKYGELNITSFCDYNGPNFPITIVAKQNGSILTVNPQTAIVILGGGCTKNRLVYNAAAADTLLSSPNNGTSKWLSPLTNATVLANATRLGIAQAVLQYGGGAASSCEQCGMNVDITGQARFKIFDATGSLHIACCPVCALRLQRTYRDLNISSFCDYYGPSYPITIIARNNGSDVTVNPPDALIIAANSCPKNRIVYNSSAADALLAPPNNGTSKWLSTLTNDTVAANATRLGVAQAALINGAGQPTPTPSPSPTPIPSASPPASPTPIISPTPSKTPDQSVEPSSSPGSTASPTESPKVSASPTSIPTLFPVQTSTPIATPSTTSGVTLECEVCGMDVTSESQARYKVTDGNGKVHYVECYMCAMQLINNYEKLHIETYCDWYGPNYPITIDTSNYGTTVTVNPSTAMYLRGGSCVTARAAYNQTAADNLLLQGFSQHTSPEQRYALPSSTEAKQIKEAIETWYAQPNTTNSQTPLTLVLVAGIGVTIIVASIFAYKKLNTSKKN